MRSLGTMFLLITLSFAVSLTCSAITAEDVFPEKADPLVGNYVGRWTDDEEIDPDISAQVVAIGDNQYRIRLASKLDIRCPQLALVEVESRRGRIKFEAGRYFGEIRNGRITGGRGNGKTTFTMEKVLMPSPSLGAQPPENGIVLFDGTDLSAWDKPDAWKVLPDGAMLITPGTGDLRTKQSFKDAFLHIEFRLPQMPKQTGQARGNSGVFLQDTYEVQVLDSYGLEGYYNECGGLYKVAAPMANVCRPPLQWQAYDITYRAPRFDASGNLTENARITVYHNGVLIHSQQEMHWLTAWKEVDRKGPAPNEAKPIRLQDHGNYVQYRNIWIVDQSAGE